MAIRTTIDTVKVIIPTALEDDEIRDIILMANVIVTRQVGGEGLATALLKDLETWMTAHLIAIGKERQPMSEKVGDIWLTFQKNEPGFLQSTSYGQMVLFLDTSGKFQQASNKRIIIRAIKQIND